MGQSISLASNQKRTKVCLYAILVMFVLCLLCLQAFNYTFADIGTMVGAEDFSALITAFPVIFLGVSSFVYASLMDFVELKKIFAVGFGLMVLGSVLGFFCNFNNIWMVIIARSIQTFGGQVSGSAFLVVTGRFLESKKRVFFYGIFNAAFQLSVVIGVLVGGYLAPFWKWLFLIPLISLAALPFIWKNLPSPSVEATSKGHIDVIGFAIFTCFVGALMLFFNFLSIESLVMVAWICLAISLVCLVIFIVYIAKAAHPFIRPRFFLNTKWVCAIVPLFIFWFSGYAITPAWKALAEPVYNVSDSVAPLVLLIPLSVAVLIGVLSGSIVKKTGRSSAIILSAVLEIAGFVVAALTMGASPWLFAVMLALYYAGYTLMYSPLVDVIINTIDPKEMGRGFGMNDLMLNVSPSIGLTVLSPFFVAGENPVDFMAEMFTNPVVAHFASVCIIFAIPAIIGLIWYLCVRRYLATSDEKTSS